MKPSCYLIPNNHYCSSNKLYSEPATTCTCKLAMVTSMAVNPPNTLFRRCRNVQLAGIIAALACPHAWMPELRSIPHPGHAMCSKAQQNSQALPSILQVAPHHIHSPTSHATMTTRNPNLNIVPGLAAQSPCPAKLQAADAELTGPRPRWWWTGKHPEQCPGFDKKAGVLRSMPLPNLANFTRQSVLDYFDNTWTLTEVLFTSLQGTAAFIRQPYHQLRHPMIFYYGHPAVLYVNKFRVAGLLTEPINQYFEQVGACCCCCCC
jgi:hypothetical protein